MPSSRGGKLERLEPIECLSSPRSIDGLRPLVRLRSRDWDRLLWQSTDDGADLPWNATVSQVLGTSLVEVLMPRGLDDRARMASCRSIARLTGELFGDDVSVEVDPEEEARVRRRLAVAVHPRTKRQLSSNQQRRVRAMRLSCADAVRRLHGARPVPRTRRRRRPSEPAPPTISARRIQRLLGFLKPMLLVAVVLAAGAGLLSGEILALMSSDFDWSKRRVRVSPGSSRGRPGTPATRFVYPAAWAWTLLEGLVPRGEPHRLLFPGRDAGRPLKRLDRNLKRACRRAFGEGGGITLLDARAFHQAAMERVRLPHQVVAGSLRAARPRTASKAEVLWWRERQAAVARAWVHLEVPPVLDASLQTPAPREAVAAPSAPDGRVPATVALPRGLFRGDGAGRAMEVGDRSKEDAGSPSGRRLVPLGARLRTPPRRCSRVSTPQPSRG